MHTAQHLVSKCLTGDLARGRTIILVTHHIAICLPTASYLLELDKGIILHQGTIPELEERGLLMKVMEIAEEPFFDPHSLDQKAFNEADILENGTVQLPKRQVSDGKLIEAEARAEGRVSMRSYVTYIRAAGLPAWFLTIVLLLVIRAINIGNLVSRNSLVLWFLVIIGQIGLLGSVG
jgi:ABC-type multidrug transport system ATPase subunit